ncbi:putative T6SS immunity periplasmic lipoprotein [Enterobacter oligotrophicus]|uniref:putative T6SS immunity periplasmic lipoprotein n=2 Tax=Enterobacter TaxID=547 RepID=UPI0030B8493D
MKSIFFMLTLCILITGCPGDNRAPKTRFTFINGNHICFSIDKNDVLNFYTIYSSKAHKISVVTGSGYKKLNIAYPNTCLNVKWEKGLTYIIHYGLNDKKYVHQFDINNNGKQINLGEL